MRNIIVIFSIFSYLVISVIIGINQYIDLGGLSKTYIITQWIVLVISIFLTLRYQNSYSQIGIVLSTLGGGIAMMVIIQAALFLIFGRFLTSNMSAGKIILLIFLGLGVVKLIHWYLTRDI